MRLLCALALSMLLAACAAKGPQRATEPQIAALAASLRSLSAAVDPAEAARAARLSYETTHRLALAYQITDHPLIHNAKVNAGRKPRGLCYHWAEDLQARLLQEDFVTLDITRAIANAENALLIDHSTAVITPKGAPMQAGIVIDPWRNGGRLFWSPVIADRRYEWHPRAEVMRRTGRIRYVQRSQGSLAPPPVD
ncbi:MAG: hypothetical protein P8N14_15690 [Sulfitobacter sp.]|jgi:hypothetical protein|nr:hypothetical protein [Sulfitobacter sp.]